VGSDATFSNAAVSEGNRSVPASELRGDGWMSFYTDPKYFWWGHTPEYYQCRHKGHL